MKSVSVTHQMERFRRKARSVWDISIGDCGGDIELTEPFFDFRRLMFCALVLGDWREAALRENDPTMRSTIGLREGEIRVFAGATGDLPVLLNSTAGAMSGSWQDIEIRIDTQIDHVYLIDVFDWDESSGMDHELYLVKIVASPTQPHLSGCYGLVQPRNCEFVLQR